MSLSGPFIQRPIGTSLLAFGLLLSGAIAFCFLPIAALPQVEFPTLQVNSSLPGADPVTMATSVSAPLERRFAQIAGVAELTSSSTLGKSRITIQFDLNREIDHAAEDVQAAINAALSDLPSNLVTRPSIEKSNPSDPPILLLALISDTTEPGTVFNYGNDVLAQKFAQVKGVGIVQVSGAERSAIRIQADPAYLASMGLGLEDIRAFLGKTNANLPKGSLDGPDLSYSLAVNDQLNTASDYAPLVAFHNSHGAVRLSDLGRVIDSIENTRQAGWYRTHPAVLINVYKQAGANVIDAVDRINAMLPQLRRWMPPAMKLIVETDRTETIRTSVNHIEFTLLVSIALVVLVVFLFLRHFWATFIPSFTVPLALAGTFVVMYVVGYTLDNLSLMALAVAVGFVVDDAIVVIENVFRYLEAGESSAQAALHGAQQIGFTVLSITISLVAVFIPLIFMTGIIGRLLHEFAVTLTAAIIVSGVVSLTFTPMMCSRFLRHEASERRPPRWSRVLEAGFAGVQRGYGRALRWVLGHQRLMLLVTVGTMVASIALYIVIPKGFFPLEDIGTLQCTTEAAQDISFLEFREKHLAAVRILMEDPAVGAIASNVMGGSNNGSMFVTLQPLAERKAGVQAIIARLRPKLARLRGITVFMQAGQDLRVGGRPSKSLFQYTLVSASLPELDHWAHALASALKAAPHFQDVTTDLQSAGLQARVVIDRVVAARLGVPLTAIDNTLYDAFGQRLVSTVYTELAQHHVVLEANPEYQLDPRSLDKIYIKSGTGQMVPLSAMATVIRTNTPLAVNHQGQFPAATVSFNLDEGYSLSLATNVIEQTAARLHMPGTVHGSFAGTARAFQDSLASEPVLILAALLAVYLILGILYESLIHPLTILSTLPSAGMGALLAMLLTGYELSIVAIIGIILLIGIVKKNAIMMIDFALEVERNENLSPEESIYRACLVRFRPITMTTMAALFGALPLALEGGVGSELHKPLGISIVGGLIVSQMLTLFTTPVVYVAMDRLHRRVRKAAPALAAETADSPPPAGSPEMA